MCLQNAPALITQGRCLLLNPTNVETLPSKHVDDTVITNQMTGAHRNERVRVSVQVVENLHDPLAVAVGEQDIECRRRRVAQPTPGSSTPRPAGSKRVRSFASRGGRTPGETGARTLSTGSRCRTRRPLAWSDAEVATRWARSNPKQAAVETAHSAQSGPGRSSNPCSQLRVKVAP